MRLSRFIGAALIALCTAAPAYAQGEPVDPINRFIWQMYQMHEGKTLCLANLDLSAVRARVLDRLQGKVGMAIEPKALAEALWSLYPCPFSPQRAELRPVTTAELGGSWLFPESSQKLRRGPRMPGPGPAGPLPVKCDGVGYFEGGELRHAVVAGVARCPFEKSSDLDAARKLPQVSRWSVLREGRVGVTRTDVSGHIEEWDVYVVAARFDYQDVSFREGDLVAYLRRENGNEVGASTQFRHLQRLQ
jgi:hypothetical protein